uniref:Uncharacterized protein n=1 Tax=Pithovirus LCPAC406 TaxID=2506599 RepID=A0A481ZH09_9VIRU|nr:MAG: hypothetical protein LCPAC406_03740 [Pithovirus LCPAC406]
MILTLIEYGTVYLCFYLMLLRLAQSIRGWFPGIDTFSITIILIGITLSSVAVKVILSEFYSAELTIIYDLLLSLIVYAVLYGGYYFLLQGYLKNIRCWYPNIGHFEKTTVLIALILALMTMYYFDISIHIKIRK